ncbi:MAG TPA: glycosyltransferase family A protein [Burkholderiales bacterium]|nr:glycosyltransferase family A protein [Burkholderiales bacterium]
MRTAIITAYYREPREILERCISSVQSQTTPADHILVADGYPQDWINNKKIRQIILDKAHADYGDSPRSIGLILALREQYDAIQFLDADNILSSNHVELMWKVQSVRNLDVVVSTRRFLRPDGSVLPYTWQADETGDHVDTGCYFFTRPSYSEAIRWSLIPKQLSCIGDRIFLSMLKNSGLRIERAIEPTVGYTNLWKDVYVAIGEVPPPGAKTLDREISEMNSWWKQLADEERKLIQNTLGISLSL